MSTRKTALLITIISLFPTLLWAGELETEKKYQIGGRSTIITGEMELSSLHPSFDDLSTDGIKGAHSSGVFLLRSVKPFFRIGVETLVGNSDENEETTMDFQAVGIVLDFIYGGKYFIAGGTHMGVMLANAMHREGETSETKVNSGTFYKSGGLFFAPYVGLGVKIKSYEFRFFTKRINVFSAEENDNVGAFSGLYTGISYGISF